MVTNMQGKLHECKKTDVNSSCTDNQRKHIKKKKEHLHLKIKIQKHLLRILVTFGLRLCLHVIRQMCIETMCAPYSTHTYMVVHEGRRFQCIAFF